MTFSCLKITRNGSFGFKFKVSLLSHRYNFNYFVLTFAFELLSTPLRISRNILVEKFNKILIGAPRVKEIAKHEKMKRSGRMEEQDSTKNFGQAPKRPF